MLTFLIIITGLVVLILFALLVHRHQQREQERSQVRRRYALKETTERMALIDTGEEVGLRSQTLRERLVAQDAAERASSEPDIASGPLVPARMVRTIDGDMLLTEPPFELRASIMSSRSGKYVNRLTRRLPPWIVVCPRVRMDSLVHATNPVGRDAEDWRDWRKRARLRAIDIVLCDRRTWRPVLAIVFEKKRKSISDMTRIGTSERADGGRGGDRIIEEIFYHIGLPLVFASGELSKDWPIITPYVDEAILRTRDQCVMGDDAHDEASALSVPQRTQVASPSAGNPPPHDEASRAEVDGAIRLFSMDDD